VRLVALVFAALGIALWVTGCSKGAATTTAAGTPPGKRVPTIAVEPVRREPISRSIELTGETVAVVSAVIAATVEGPVGYCPWREGDRVEKAGQKLIEIDRELYRAEVKAAEAAVEVAKAKLADMQAGTRPEEIARARETVRQSEESALFAKNDMDRTAKLASSGVLPGEVLDKARTEHATQQSRLAAARQQLEMLEAGATRTAIAVQEAAVKEAQARLELAQARLNECVIAAPFAGTVTRVHARPGDMAAMKAPLLELADVSSLVVRVAVPEAYTASVAEGMTARVSLDAFPGRTFAANVARLYPALDPRMRTRTVELTLEGQADVLPNMFARVDLVLQSVGDAVAVPHQAVVLTPAGRKVAYVLVDGKAVVRQVQTGIEQAGRVQVLSGLEPGDAVVVTGNEKLKDGDDVRVAEPGNAPGAKAGASAGGGAAPSTGAKPPASHGPGGSAP